MAGADKNTRRIDPGRSSHQSPKSVDKAASGETTVKKSQAEEDAEWGYEASRSGMAIEAKLGGMIVVILLCAFAFLVYTKFDRRQRQMLAGKSHETEEQSDVPEDAGASGEQLAAAQASGFDEFYPGETPSDAAQPELDSHSAEVPDFESTAVVDQQRAPSDDEVFRPGDAFAKTPVRTFAPEPPTAESSAEITTNARGAEPDFGTDPFDATLADTPPLQTEVPLAQLQPSTPEAPTKLNPLFDEGGSGEEALASAADSTPDFSGMAADNAFAATPAPQQPEPPRESPDQKLADLLDNFEPTEEEPESAKDSSASEIAITAPPEDLFADFAPDNEKQPTSAAFDPQPDESSAQPLTDSLITKSESPDFPPQDAFSSQEVLQSDSGAAEEVPLLEEFEPQSTDIADSSPEQPTEPTLIAMVDEAQSRAGLFNDVAPKANSPAQPPAETQPEPLPNTNQPAKIAQQSTVFDGFPVDTQDEVPLPPEPTAKQPGFPLTLPSFADAKPRPADTPSSSTAPNSTSKANENYGVAHFLQGTGIQQVAAKEEPTRICTVKEKDTYWTISKRHYGTVRYFSSLALYNQHRIRDPRKLRPGMKVLLPEPEVLEKKYPEFFPENKRKPRNLTTAATGFIVLEDGSPAYRIGKNETLSGISLKHLGRASRWMEIFRLNRKVLTNPNKLKPGTVIRLPDDAASVQMAP